MKIDLALLDVVDRPKKLVLLDHQTHDHKLFRRSRTPKGHRSQIVKRHPNAGQAVKSNSREAERFNEFDTTAFPPTDALKLFTGTSQCETARSIRESSGRHDVTTSRRPSARQRSRYSATGIPARGGYGLSMRSIFRKPFIFADGSVVLLVDSIRIFMSVSILDLRG
jgi:hypothetical protein